MSPIVIPRGGPPSNLGAGGSAARSSNADFVIKQGDTALILEDTILGEDGEPVDLTGATVTFVMRALTAAAAMTLTGVTTSPDPIAGTVHFAPAGGDTAIPGLYMANWTVLFPDGTNMTFPIVGYRSVSIEENLTTPGGQQLVGLPDVKRKLRIAPDNPQHDSELIRYIHGAQPVIEEITGPIIPRIFDEWHDGGHTFISLRHTPHTGYGTSPILNLLACSEYNGPIEWTLKVVASPEKGEHYSVMVDVRGGRVVRRTAGGGVQPFPSMPQSVHVVYEAGQQQVPANVYEATLELIRVNYQTTQAVGSGRLAEADTEDQQQPALGFFVPRRVREMLAPTRKHPALA